MFGCVQLSDNRASIASLTDALWTPDDKDVGNI
jgi:hypothetical protein